MRKAIPTSALVQLFEQAARAMHSLGHDGGLYPAQWTALRYFASAEADQRTAIALSRFQGLAFGPVNRTVRTLIAKGYLEKAGSAGRGRTTRIELTEDGRDLLKRDPLDIVVTAVGELTEPQKEALAASLEHVLRAVHSRNG